jgi:hypothetical protein
MEPPACYRMFVKGSLMQGIYPIKPLNKQSYRLNSSAEYVYCVNKIKKGKVNVKRAAFAAG